MRIAVIEDEAVHRDYIQQQVLSWLALEDPAGQAETFPDAKAFLFAREDRLFDLLLVDIKMPGMDGMELVRTLRLRGDRVQVVFLTGEASYVFEGYKVEALDYLLKPIRKEDLWKVLKRARAQCQRKLPSLLLESPEGLRRIELTQILYLEAQNKDLHVFLHTEALMPEDLCLRASLEEWKEKISAVLEEDMAFAQPHRSYFCNLAWVQRIEASLLHMVQGGPLPLARSRRHDVMDAYFAFCRGRRKLKG